MESLDCAKSSSHILAGNGRLSALDAVDGGHY